MFNTQSMTTLSINLVAGMMTSDNQVCRVDMSQSAKNIHNFIRGLDSSPGAFKEHQLQPPNIHIIIIINKINFIQGLDSSPGAFKQHQLQP